MISAANQPLGVFGLVFLPHFPPKPSQKPQAFDTPPRYIYWRNDAVFYCSQIALRVVFLLPVFFEVKNVEHDPQSPSSGLAKQYAVINRHESQQELRR